MDRQKFEQRCAIKFCVKLDESATVTYEKLQRAYGEHFLSRAQVFRLHKSFLEGREQVERVRSLVRSDRRLTLRMITSELNLNGFTVHQILIQDLGMDAAPRQAPFDTAVSIKEFLAEKKRSCGSSAPVLAESQSL
jgi:hypothetical protein